MIKNEVGETLLKIVTRYPQSKKQEYEQIMKDYDRTGVKPKDLNFMLKAATEKSIQAAKLFISLNLDHHDTSSISQCVSDIIAHTKADHFDEEIFDDAEQFYQKSALNDENNKESLLSNKLKLDLLMEREGLLDINQKIEKNKGHEDAQYRIKQQVKHAVPSSVGLRECLKSISEKFAWSSEKMGFMILMSGFINIFMGTGFYGLDLYTDAIFSKDMLNQRNRNFSQETTACKNDL